MNTENREEAASQTVARCMLAYVRARQEGHMLDMSTHGHRDNRLLALPSEIPDLMARDLRQISLAPRQAIYEPGAPIEEIYFPLADISLRTAHVCFRE